MNDQPLEVVPHSPFGVASFTVGLTLALLICIAFTFSIFIGIDELEEDPMLSDAEASAALALIGCSVIPLNLVGILLGIVAFIQQKRKRLFAILGCALNGLVLVGMGLLYLL